MPSQSVWKHIDVQLRPLSYRNTTVSGKGKGSTTWAAHSHTPVKLEVWDGFDELVKVEGMKPRNQRLVDIDFGARLDAEFLPNVSEEEHVTDSLAQLLRVFSRVPGELSGGFEFPKSNSHITANPDIIAEKRDTNNVHGVGDRTDYESPLNRASARRRNLVETRALYTIPFESKPFWKFQFIDNANVHEFIIREFKVPENFDAEKMRDEESLPGDWNSSQRKVFRLVRQIYGQMASDQRRYGIMHTYERWFFCQRTEEEHLRISRTYCRTDTSPSVFQAIKTMVGFDDYFLELNDSVIHPKSASKAPPKKKSKQGGGDEMKKEPPRPPNDVGDGKSDEGRRHSDGASTSELRNLAAEIYPWDCDLFDATDNVQLLTTKKDPNILVKMQRDPRNSHVAADMLHEAKMYAILERLPGVREVIPRFYGFSNHLGVSMICTERELDDFEDIGLENLSESAKQSAVRAVEVLSEAGVLHKDIALRNIVLSKDDQNRAKIIDFGRALLSSERGLLADQVKTVQRLLKMQ